MGKTPLHGRGREIDRVWPGPLTLADPRPASRERHGAAIATPGDQPQIQPLGVSSHFCRALTRVQHRIHALGFRGGRAGPAARKRAVVAAEACGACQHNLVEGDDYQSARDFFVAPLLLFRLAWLKLPAREKN